MYTYKLHTMNFMFPNGILVLPPTTKVNVENVNNKIIKNKNK